MTRFFVIFLILFGIIYSVYCENHSGNYSNQLQLNHKKDSESPALSLSKTFKENLLESSLKKKIKEKRRLIYNEDDTNSERNSERGESIEFSTKRINNFSEAENEKISDWGNLRFQLPIPEHSHNFPDVSIRQPFQGTKHSNQKHDWRSDVFDKTQSRWNEEKNFRDFQSKDVRGGSHHNGRYEGAGEMNRENMRGDHFDRRVSITTFNEGEVGHMKNYNDDRVGSIHSGHMGHPSMSFYNRHPNTFWNPNFFKPEKEVVINLKTECSTPREINNQLVHKFIVQPKSPLTMQSGFSAYQIPKSSYISSYKMTPMYYL